MYIFQYKLIDKRFLPIGSILGFLGELFNCVFHQVTISNCPAYAVLNPY